MISLLVEVFIATCVFFIILLFLIPMLPAPFGMIATIFLVLVAIAYLVYLVGRVRTNPILK